MGHARMPAAFEPFHLVTLQDNVVTVSHHVPDTIKTFQVPIGQVAWYELKTGS